ncbi:hypothetical protein QQF64_009593 [Cirrhinus molitorella]|uniref:Transposase n=1 Tax=Cirrhinus molitorella TaxID=172907 RepID=A0ABR3M439_9TELE
MRSAADKRKEKEMSRASRGSDSLHTYASAGNFPLPESPCKPPLKKGKAEDDAVISTLSQLINSRSDALEKMVGENALKIEGLKKTVDFVCAELNDIKGKVGQFEARLNTEKKKMEQCEKRIADLERYSRRWNLRLHGISEKENENVRAESIRVCMAIFPEESKTLPDKIDTVHRIGKKLPNSTRPRAIIIQFCSRVTRDGVWRAAKSSEFLRANGLRFSEDLTTFDRERRLLLWPVVEKARKEGKRAHFVGHRAFIDGSEFNPMVRHRKRSTSRGVTREVLSLAAREVERNRSVRSVAGAYGICHVTLHRFLIRKRKLEERHDGNNPPLPPVGYSSHRKVFTQEQEEQLVGYLTRAASICYGLSPKEVRKLAFQCAVQFQCTFPESWSKSQMAGKDWFTGFLKRNRSLSIRKPQATSVARASSFNVYTVGHFFNNLNTVYTTHKFTPNNIWNTDETGVTTVQAPEKIIATRGVRQTGAMTSGERGKLVTVAVAINALGNSIPPFFVFPCKRFHAHFIHEGPPASAGAANGSGWMQAEEFMEFLNHFAKHTKPTQETKVHWHLALQP